MKPLTNISGWTDQTIDTVSYGSKQQKWATPTMISEISDRKAIDQSLAEWYIQCELHGMEKLTSCIEIHRDRRGGVPVLRGTNFTVAQVLAELSETKGPDEIAEYFGLDVDSIKEVLNGLSLLVNKPFIK